MTNYRFKISVIYRVNMTSYFALVLKSSQNRHLDTWLKINVSLPYTALIIINEMLE